MATPNLVNVSSVTPFTIAGAVTTSATDVIDVPADKAYKINTIIIANVDGTNAADISASISTDNGVSYFGIASTVSVPADATLVLLDTPIYLMEADVLKGGASAASDLDLVISYEVIDDA